MHFAAAVMARGTRAGTPRPDYAEHAQKARAAKSDALLATNVKSHLQ